MAHNTQQILGKDLKVGDIVWSQGYRFKIDRIEYDPCRPYAGDPPRKDNLGRWYLYAHAINAPDLPSVYRDHMELALREDLHWTKCTLEEGEAA